jgi:hypothetical protein
MKPSRPLLATFALAGLSAVTSGAAIGGTAEVRFIAPERFADLATNRSQEVETMNALGAYVQQLASALPADQVLRVDVLDVDLAGTMRPTRRGNVRVNNGLSDAPMIHLRYTLQAGGQVVRTGEDRLVDVDYTHTTGSWRATSQFYYEKRMLADWFARTFGQTQAAR